MRSHMCLARSIVKPYQFEVGSEGLNFVPKMSRGLNYRLRDIQKQCKILTAEDSGFLVTMIYFWEQKLIFVNVKGLFSM
jgi:hypothetical protein